MIINFKAVNHGLSQLFLSSNLTTKVGVMTTELQPTIKVGE